VTGLAARGEDAALIDAKAIVLPILERMQKSTRQVPLRL
jgi:hypothetical protein